MMSWTNANFKLKLPFLQPVTPEPSNKMAWVLRAEHVDLKIIFLYISYT